MLKIQDRGLLFVVSAPSGVGKTTLIQAVHKIWPDLRYSVSCTTRPARPHEIPGKDYHFLGRQEFLSGITSGRFLEWAEVHGEFYGTDVEWVEKWLSEGDDVLLDIDIQGARQVRCDYPFVHTIFILPPSLKALKERLLRRGTESREQVSLRFAAAQVEIQEAPCYEFIIVNDVLDRAIADFDAVLRACHCARAFQMKRLKSLLTSPNVSSKL